MDFLRLIDFSDLTLRNVLFSFELFVWMHWRIPFGMSTSRLNRILRTNECIFLLKICNVWIDSFTLSILTVRYNAYIIEVIALILSMIIFKVKFFLIRLFSWLLLYIVEDFVRIHLIVGLLLLNSFHIFLQLFL